MEMARGWRSPALALGLLTACAGLAVLGTGREAVAARPQSKAPTGTGAKPDFLDAMIRDSWD